MNEHVTIEQGGAAKAAPVTLADRVETYFAACEEFDAGEGKVKDVRYRLAFQEVCHTDVENHRDADAALDFLRREAFEEELSAGSADHDLEALLDSFSTFLKREALCSPLRPSRVRNTFEFYCEQVGRVEAAEDDVDIDREADRMSVVAWAGSQEPASDYHDITLKLVWYLMDSGGLAPAPGQPLEAQSSNDALLLSAIEDMLRLTGGVSVREASTAKNLRGWRDWLEGFNNA